MKLSTHEMRASSFLTQVRGLMFRRKQNCLMIFPKEKKISLHTWFVFFPLQISLIDKRFQVIEQKKMRPFQYWAPQNKAQYILEIGTTENINFHNGNTIKII